MPQKSAIDEISELVNSARTGWTLLKWSFVGPAFIGVGISQATMRWMGDTFVLAYLYPVALIVVGSVISVFMFSIVFDVPIFTSASHRATIKANAETTLKRLVTGNYGPFELTGTLQEELALLESKGLVTSLQEDVPEKGSELCEYYAVIEAVKQFFADR